MAGHSKFKNIQHRKGRQDKAKSAKNTYFAQAIYNLARNINTPSSDLKNLIDRAKANDVPNDIIDRALKKVNEQNSGEIIYYAASLHPLYVIIKCNITNKNRYNLIKSAFTHYNFNIISLQSCEHIFCLYTILSINNTDYKLDDLLDLFGDYLIDIIQTNDEFIIYSQISNYNNINNIVTSKNINFDYLSIGYLPNHLELENEIIDNLIDDLQELPEVEEIYTNICYIPTILN